MFRQSARRLSRAPLSSSSSSVILPSDVAFQFPRFNPATHLSDSLPELKLAKKELAATTRDAAAARPHLQRAAEIFSNLCPDGTVGGPNTPAYLLKDWLSVAATMVRAEPLARTPTADKRRLHFLAPLVRTTASAPLTDMVVFDALCVIVAAYADAALRLATYGDGGYGSLDKDSSVGKAENLTPFKSPDVEAGLITFGELCEITERLVEVAYGVAVDQTSTASSSDDDDPTAVISSVRSSYAALCALRSLLEIPCTGALHTSLEIIDRPLRLRGTDEGIAALLVAMRGELRVRLEADAWGTDAIDELVNHEFLLASERIHCHFTPRGRPDSGITMTGEERLRDAYTSVALSKAGYYLSMAKDPKGESPGVYAPKAARQLSLSPVLLVPSGGPLVQDASTRVPLASSKAKHLALEELERALKINRALFADHRTNLKSGYILRLLAATYAELKDYMYANGLFNSSLKVFEEHYGMQSLEVAETLRWLEGYHRFVGSDQEADSMLGRIRSIRAHHGVLQDDDDDGANAASSLASLVGRPKGPKVRAMNTKH